MRFIAVISIRRREENATISSCGRLFKRLATHKRKPEVFYVDRGYSSFTIIENMHSLGVSVFGTTRDFDGRSNFHGPFEFMNDKDGATMIVPIIFKIPTDHPIHRPNSQLVRTHVRVSGCGCALEFDAAAGSEKLIAVGRRNGGQSGTGVTVIFSADLEGKRTLPGCLQSTACSDYVIDASAPS